MANKRKKWPWVLGGIVAVLAVAYAVLFGAGATSTGDWVFNLAEVRRLADSIPGSKPTEIHLERVVDFNVPHAFARAGQGWSMMPMAVYSYQLVFPGQTAIIDTAMTKPLGGGSLDAAALARMNDALTHASMITITHEHGDHIGGLLDHPKVRELLKVARLNAEQVNHSEMYEPSKFPAAPIDGFVPLPNTSLVAVMPGVVIIRAAGHSPGSQLVYVKRADGQELLFLGDVAWREDNITAARERPMLLALLIHEDRGQVQRELEQLRALRTSNPEVHQVPGHDPSVVDALVEQGLLVRGFVAR